ncbi:MAG: tetratricopeptide repeat protein [Proteobacteria bacterium]|nr:tetratricopeptide repeat protein [Pseudomonadota bacterium]
MVSAVDKALREASKHEKLGDFDAAEGIYQDILEKYPSNRRSLLAYKKLKQKLHTVDAGSLSTPKIELENLTNLVARSAFDEAIELGDELLKRYPDDVRLMQLIGSSYTSKGQHKKAVEVYERVIKIQPENISTLNLLGVLYNSLGELDKAIHHFKNVLKADASNASAYNNLGLLFKAKGDFKKAAKNIEKSLEVKNDDAYVWDNLGLTLAESGDFSAAIKAFDEAIKLKPSEGKIIFNKGMAVADLGRSAEATQLYLQAEKLGFSDIKLHVNMGIVELEAENFDAAIQRLEKALKIDPRLAQAHFNLGKVYEIKKDWRAALKYYGKAVSCDPTLAPAFNNMGGIFKDSLDKPETAIQSFETVAALLPNDPTPLQNIANCYIDLKNLPKAIEILDSVISINKASQTPVAQQIHLRARICDWSTREKDKQKCLTLDGEVERMNPFSLLPLIDNPQFHLLRSQNYSKHVHKLTCLPTRNKPNERPKKLRIGYLSGDFYQHPVSRILVRSLELHDRDRFEIYGYSTSGFLEDHMRERIIKSVDVFDDVRLISDQEVAHLVRQDEIDIAVDLSGYTRYERTGIFARRPAPIQINYLGYPGSLGTSFMDYIIGDKFLIPEASQHVYSEKPIYLPDGYQSRDDTIKLPENLPNKSFFGLPESGFVFCAINNYYKIGPEPFTIWMSLLKQVPNSVLWLLGNDLTAKQNLLNEAEIRGVHSSRLVFAETRAYEVYLAALNYADLYLDTFIYNAGATAADVLHAGVPLITKSGAGYSSRMAGSLLSGLGLTELITYSDVEYANLALKLASSPDELSRIRQKLSDSLKNSTFTNPEKFTRNLEKGFDLAYENYLKSASIEPIEVY